MRVDNGPQVMSNFARAVNKPSATGAKPTNLALSIDPITPLARAPRILYRPSDVPRPRTLEIGFCAGFSGQASIEIEIDELGDQNAPERITASFDLATGKASATLADNTVKPLDVASTQAQCTGYQRESSVAILAVRMSARGAEIRSSQ